MSDHHECSMWPERQLTDSFGEVQRGSWESKWRMLSYLSMRAGWVNRLIQVWKMDRNSTATRCLMLWYLIWLTQIYFGKLGLPAVVSKMVRTAISKLKIYVYCTGNSRWTWGPVAGKLATVGQNGAAIYLKYYAMAKTWSADANYETIKSGGILLNIVKIRTANCQ